MRKIGRAAVMMMFLAILAAFLTAGSEGKRGVATEISVGSAISDMKTLQGQMTHMPVREAQTLGSGARPIPTIYMQHLRVSSRSDEVLTTGTTIAMPETEMSQPETKTSKPQTITSKSKPAELKSSHKTVYLTFDDGPSDLTHDILDILGESNIPATFFVLGQYAEARPEIINRMYEEGHAIGNHTYDHRYDKLYGRFQDFWHQIKQTEEIIRLITSERPQLVRAPGGTAGHFDETYFRLMEQAGYRVFDWNVDGGDSRRKGVPASEIVDGATAPVKGNEAIVLLHDGTGHKETVKALPKIIDHYKQNGYTFKALSPDTAPVQFRVSGSVPERPTPSKQWISEHIKGNSALFAPGKVLVIEFGGLETTFEPGEYEIVNGRLFVPLRALVERLGGEVAWNQNDKTVQVALGEEQWRADPLNGLLSKAGELSAASGVHLRGGKVWAPLREVMGYSSHPVRSVNASDTERRVVASRASIF